MRPAPRTDLAESIAEVSRAQSRLRVHRDAREARQVAMTDEEFRNSMLLRWAHTVAWAVFFTAVSGGGGLLWGLVFLGVRTRNHLRVARQRREAAIARVGTFDAEAAAREAEAFGFPAEVFRMTLPVPAPVTAPTPTTTRHRRSPRDLVDRTVRSAQAAQAAWRG